MKFNKKNTAKITKGAMMRIDREEYQRKHRTIRVNEEAYVGLKVWCKGRELTISTIVDYLIIGALDCGGDSISCSDASHKKVSVTLSLANRNYLDLKELADPTVSAVISALLVGFWQDIS